MLFLLLETDLCVCIVQRQLRPIRVFVDVERKVPSGRQVSYTWTAAASRQETNSYLDGQPSLYLPSFCLSLLVSTFMFSGTFSFYGSLLQVEFCVPDVM